jgi:hypothetical protein
VFPDRLDKHCIDAEPMLDKKGGQEKIGCSAHLLLWICRPLSTSETVFGAFDATRTCFRSMQDTIAVSDATLASRSFCRQG